MRPAGFVLIELVIGLAVIGLLMVLAVPRVASVRDWLAVDRAAQEAATFYYQARQAATLRISRVRIEFRADSLRAVYEGGVDSTFLVRRGPASHGVDFTVSRSVIRLYANGLGFGAANTKLVFQRGAARAILTTSRLGRLKRW